MGLKISGTGFKFQLVAHPEYEGSSSHFGAPPNCVSGRTLPYSKP